MMRRREFLAGAALGTVGLLVCSPLAGQESTQPRGGAGPAEGSTSNLFDMNQGAAQTVRRPPKANAVASMTPAVRDDLEHQIRCQCGCTLDIYTCRTTDFSCQVSPAMHRDVMSLVEGGYSAAEILDAFVGTYGERALMAPRREGFNLAGYLVPFAALAAGAVAVVVVLRRMQRGAGTVATAIDARQAALGTDDEMARLDAAIKRDV